MFTNKKYPCIFYSFQTYFCCQSRLRMHLVSHFKMKSAIVMILLAMVAVTQANKTGMNNIYGCINRVFMAQKYINKLQQHKEKSQYIVLKYYIENSAFAYEKLCRSRAKYVIHLGR